jgi:transcriptional repressor NrdR
MRGDREILSRVVGDLVMEELRNIDEVAYVRFASIYRSFQDVDAFHKEIEQLRQPHRKPDAAREAKKLNKDQLSLLPGEPAPVKDK